MSESEASDSEIDQEHPPTLAPALAVQFTKNWLLGLNDLNALTVLPSGYWEPKGPAPLRPDGLSYNFGPDAVAGAVVDILVHPDDPNTIFAATGHGGVWLSTDAGVHFKPTMDGLPSLSMSALAVDFVNHNVVYAGCGGPLHDSFSESAGLYKSIDRGLSWSIADGGINATVFLGRSIRRIVSNAADSLVVGTSDGLFRSVDGGINFGNNAPAFDNGKAFFGGSVTSLELDKAAPTTSILFCVSGSYTGTPGTTPSPPIQPGVFRLTIDGTTPAQSLFSNPGAPARFGDLVLAQSTARGTTPETKNIYVSVQITKPPARPNASEVQDYVGLFKSSDSGVHWAPMPAAKIAEQSDTINALGKPAPDQTNYDLTVGVDPTNPDCVYIGFQELWRSLNGGATFGSFPVTRNKVHFDHHALVFGPPATPFTPIFVGEDGGLARSDDGGVHWISLNESFSTSMVFGLDMSRLNLGLANHDFTYAAMQDTGTGGHRTFDPGTDWHVALGGDGSRVAVDPADPLIVFGFANETFARSKDGGKTWQAADAVPRLIGIGLPNKDVPRRLALNPNAADPKKRVVVVSQDKDLYRSNDGGVNFSKVTLKVPFTSPITAMEFVLGDPARMWVALGDGTIHFTADDLKTFDGSSFPTNPNGKAFITGIAADPGDPLHDRVAVCCRGFDGDNAKKLTRHVFLRDNATAQWKDISGTLNPTPFANVPDLDCFAIAFDGKTTPSSLVVATVNAVLTSADLGNTWKILGVGLPNTTCTSLAIDNLDISADPRVLRVGTYGRSCFEFTKPATQKLFVSGGLAFPPAAIGQIRSLSLQLFNPGAATLTIGAITGTTVDFQLFTPLPITIPANSQKPADFHFAPTVAGNLATTIQIVSDDPTAPTTTIPASGQSTSTAAARLAVLGNLNFGLVNSGDTATATFNVYNMGTKDLNVLGVSRKDGSSDFELVGAPAFPFLLSPTLDQEFTVQFKPSSNGPLSANFQIDSDASQASALITATGTGSSHMSEVLIVVLVIVGAALVVGGGIAIYEATK